MLFSQLALIVLVVLAMATGYVPWWLGVVTLLAWGAAKLGMRGVIRQVERRELLTQRLGGSKLEVLVERLAADADAAADSGARYWLDVTLTPPSPDTEWFPLQIEAFEIRGADSGACRVEACMIWRGDTFVPCMESIVGSGRVRLLIETLQSTTSIVLSHQEERLGSVSLRN